MPRPPSYQIHRAMHRLAAAAALAVLCASPAAQGETLAELLAAVASNARFPAPARADVTVTRPRDAAAAPVRAVLVGRGTTLYVEWPDGRALVRPGKTVVAAGRRVRRAAPDARFGATDLLLDDLRVFSPATLALPQISDDGPAGVVVTSAPAGRAPYALLVLTIDRARRTIGKTQYYRDTRGSLVKIRRDGDFGDVGGHARPATIDVDDLTTDTSTHLALAWRAADDLPVSLFTPAGLAAAPPLLAPGGP